MNVIGILKKHNPQNICARELDDLISGAVADHGVMEQVIAYLNQGIPTIKFMSDVHDTDGQSMGRLVYFTDGEWLWPGYYIAYLEKYPGIQVPKIFIDHVLEKQQVPALTREEIFYAEYMTDKLLCSGGVPKNGKPPRIIQHLIEARGKEFVCY